MTANNRPDNRRGNVAFATIIITVVAVWGWLLPELAETDTVRSRDQWLDQHQIDPAAMFYTDLPLPESVAEWER